MDSYKNILDLPARTAKPRTYGITSIHDVRLNTTELAGILKDYESILDIVKFGVGTAYVTPNLERKIELYKASNVQIYFGGTLFEKFYHQNKIPEYIKFMKSCGVSMVEVSTGTIELELNERIRLVKLFRDKGFTVLSEVGTKDADTIMPPSKWIEEIEKLLEAGSEYVITEGRNSGTAGVYRPSGEIRTGLVEDIIHIINPKKLIFEAPSPKAQMYFINHVGSNVNLGNVNPYDLILLESQRVGLRNETFFINS